MNSILVLVGTLICAALWLALLVATDFQPIVVGAGLLAVLIATGSTPGTGHHPGRHA